MDTMESLFTIKPDAPKEYPVDALLRSLDRAHAIVQLMIGDCCYTDSPLSRTLLGHALDAVGGDLEMIREMVKHGFQSTQEGGA